MLPTRGVFSFSPISVIAYLGSPPVSNPSTCTTPTTPLHDMHTSDTASLDISQPLLVRVVKERRYAESGRWRTCSVLVSDSFTGTRIQVCEKRMRL
jgi:hypothetical protein